MRKTIYANRKYPWEEWFGQPRVVIRAGVDYHVSQSMMYQMIRNRASKCGLKVNLEDIGNAIIIEVREVDIVEIPDTRPEAAVPTERSVELAEVPECEDQAEEGSQALHAEHKAASSPTRGHHYPRRSKATRR